MRTKIYVLVCVLLAICGCKKEGKTCVKDTSITCCNRSAPLTEQEIATVLEGEWLLKRNQCGWGIEGDFDGCISIIFSANGNFKTFQNGGLIENGNYSIINASGQDGIYFIEATSTQYLDGTISLDENGRIMTCGNLSADGCSYFFTKK